MAILHGCGQGPRFINIATTPVESLATVRQVLSTSNFERPVIIGRFQPAPTFLRGDHASCDCYHRVQAKDEIDPILTASMYDPG